MPHIHSESTIGNDLTVNMRQKAGSKLAFVTFAYKATSTDVNINTSGVSPGVYTLELESYDTAGGVFSTLKTDTIIITVTGIFSTAVEKCFSFNQPFFTSALEDVFLTVG